MTELDYGKIGARIRCARKERDWSQEELAKKCGISAAFLGHIERGTRKMSLETFVSLCRVMELDADVLLWGITKPLSSVMQEVWAHPEKKDGDSYAMYIRIMKSVADIMGKSDEFA